MSIEQTTITPVGTVISYHGITAPEGYFACDGAEFDAAVYPKLAAVLGKNKVPDLRGYFIRGYDTRNDVDTNGAGRALGSAQGDAIRNITGTVYASVARDSGTYIAARHGGSGAFYPLSTNITRCLASSSPQTNAEVNSSAAFDASKVVPVAAENRPKNVNLLYCIKHDEPETPAPQPVIPDLRLGQETLWPMRYQGKQVYAKLINFGALPASGTRFISHNIADIEWCQVSWDYSTVRGGNATQTADLATLGVVSTAPPAYNIHWRIFTDKKSIHAHPLNAINTNADWSAVVCVLYTKTTDEPLP